MNRMGVKEWSKHKTATDVIVNTGFDGYGGKEYKYVMDYLDNCTGNNQLYENLVNTVIPVYNGTISDSLDNAQLFYSPKSMLKRIKSKWNLSEQLVEIKIEGINSNDFRFYKYK